jgi:hypothetical protein
MTKVNKMKYLETLVTNLKLKKWKSDDMRLDVVTVVLQLQSSDIWHRVVWSIDTKVLNGRREYEVRRISKKLSFILMGSIN